MSEVTIWIALRTQLQRLRPLIADQRGMVVRGCICVVLSIGLMLAYPQILRIIIDEGIEGGDGSRITNLALIMVGILCLEAPATYFRAFYFDQAARRVGQALQLRFLGHMLRQEIGFFDRERAGELNARLSGDTQVLAALVSFWIPEGLRFALYGLFGLALMVYTSPILTLLALVIGPPIAFGTSYFGQRIRERAHTMNAARADASASALQIFSGIRTVRAYDQEKAELSDYGRSLDHVFEVGTHHTRATAALEGLTAVSTESAIVLSIWAGGMLILRGNLSAGELVSFIFYAGLLVRSFRNVSRFLAEIMRSHGASVRVFQLLEREPEMAPDGGLIPETSRGRVELQGVHFSYPSRPDVEVLHGVDLVLDPGEFIAVVGPSGSGKSTIASLAARLYDPASGRVLYDGHDLRELDGAWLREQVCLVSQDSSLFGRSVLENVTFGSPGAEMDEVVEALEAANALGFVQALPDGLNTHVGDQGVVFSGGQRQRLAIARALLRRPRVLMLDEATSALDAENESLVKHALRKLPYAPTILIVAHRLSTVVDVDRVIVVDQGRIAAQGAHSELLRTSPVYRDLVETQLVSE